MNRSIITATFISLSAVAAISTMASCGIVADEVAEEATEELATEVEHRLEAGSAQTGVPTDDFALIETALREVVLTEAEREVGSFQPRYTGLVDADDDGLDDDGQVEIVVRREASCVHADGHDAVTIAGPCPG